jgi:hypothetical protein
LIFTISKIKKEAKMEKVIMIVLFISSSNLFAVQNYKILLKIDNLIIYQEDKNCFLINKEDNSTYKVNCGKAKGLKLLKDNNYTISKNLVIDIFNLK